MSIDVDEIEQRVRSAKAEYVISHNGSPPRMAFDCIALIAEVRRLQDESLGHASDAGDWRVRAYELECRVKELEAALAALEAAP